MNTIWFILCLLLGLSTGAGYASKDKSIIVFAIITGIIWASLGLYILNS